VHKGIVLDTDVNEQEMAVKVMHPNVDDDIDADYLDIMHLSVQSLKRLPFDMFQNIKWLNLEGFIDKMDQMLKIQLDL
jgi:predicted unusual protein kinase regulating ubiquinone biosynthesis (AarF/ABC1/UbiB family)